MKRSYRCECGKEFSNSQSFNGHKSKCAIHHKVKGNYDQWKLQERDVQLKRTKSLKDHSRSIKELKQKIWLEENHACETCGKLMTQKFGSGRFCSRSCANKRVVSAETKIKIGTKLKLSDKRKEEDNRRKLESINRYAANPNLCHYCGHPMPFENRNLKYCSEKCRKEGKSSTAFKKLHRADTSRHWRGHFKWGTYKGFWCDSSWELAFVMYCLDHEIDIVQNHDSFIYKYDNGTHKYTPDFIVDGTYVEIKGYFTPKDKQKIQQFPERLHIRLITRQEIKKYLTYVESVYGKQFFNLYDKNSPSWLMYLT